MAEERRLLDQLIARGLDVRGMNDGMEALRACMISGGLQPDGTTIVETKSIEAVRVRKLLPGFSRRGSHSPLAETPLPEDRWCGTLGGQAPLPEEATDTFDGLFFFISCDCQYSSCARSAERFTERGERPGSDLNLEQGRLRSKDESQPRSKKRPLEIIQRPLFGAGPRAPKERRKESIPALDIPLSSKNQRLR